MRRAGEYLRAWDGEKIKGLRYTSLKENDLGYQNHFQGFMRLRRGPYAAVSGGGRLMVYSIFNFRLGPGPSRQLRFTEFRPHPLQATALIKKVENGWIELYEKPFSEGRFFSVHGERDSWITDYDRLLVRSYKRGFQNKVSSARFRIPEGARYPLFGRKNFKKPLINLLGTGKLEEVPDFSDVQIATRAVTVTDMISSSRYEFLHPDGTWRIDRPV